MCVIIIKVNLAAIDAHSIPFQLHESIQDGGGAIKERVSLELAKLGISNRYT